jgi:P4 family phage/plasmid primase-like protien
MTLEATLLGKGYAAGEVTEIVSVFGTEPEREFVADLEAVAQSVNSNVPITGTQTTQPWKVIGAEIAKNGVPPRQAYSSALSLFMPRVAMAIVALVSMTKQAPPQAAPAASRQGKSDMTHPILRDKYLAQYPETCFGLEEYRRYKNGVWCALPALDMHKELEHVIEDASKTMKVRPTAGLQASVQELVKIEAHVNDNIFDANKEIVVCGNGTIHIPTRTLRAWDKKDYATIALEYNYDPNATADTWTWFLKNTVPEAEDFLREFSGYCITNSTRYEIALWLYGQPGGGKSTFIAGLIAMLGSLATSLSLHDVQESRFGLAQLPGKTLAFSADNPADFLKTASTLNSIISGEPITIEKKFQNAYTITPKAKLVWSMNDFPRVDSGGHGLFRRVKVVEFPQIPEGKRDPTVKERIEKEGAGILNWALLGLDRLNQNQKFTIPQCVKDATKEFIEGNDVVAIFVDEKLVKDPAGQYPPSEIASSLLYNTYKDWCLDNGHKPSSSTRIARDWKRLGLMALKKNSSNFWTGFGWKP